jgi:hypothetical protein
MINILTLVYIPFIRFWNQSSFFRDLSGVPGLGVRNLSVGNGRMTER